MTSWALKFFVECSILVSSTYKFCKFKKKKQCGNFFDFEEKGETFKLH